MKLEQLIGEATEYKILGSAHDFCHSGRPEEQEVHLLRKERVAFLRDKDVRIYKPENSGG